MITRKSRPLFLTTLCTSTTLMPVAAAAQENQAVTGWVSPASVGVSLTAVALGYLFGLRRLWLRAGTARGLRLTHVGLFLGGLVLIAVLLLSRLNTFAETLLSAHMIQHFALMLIAAPLIVLGKPGIAIFWSLSPAWRTRLHKVARHRMIQMLTHPLGAWLIYFIVLWVWHMPPMHQAALRIESVHVVQHASFFGAALLFWHAVFVRSRGETRAAAFGAIFVTALHSCALAALLTTSQVLWYPAYAGGLRMSALQDQQLGGLIMWVPCCAILLGAALGTLARLMSDLEQRLEHAS
ncbi:cytochrome c oxidase assembly protein [Loktanella sp. SALINAS62]|uniref:cytochrome c oxidase assembly protein n=1 Tax=Loktanella sp. SALINAS62 TaxID=2706124 RepID=UPI001B8AF804|nr:cytochrome c oxidase assembly protein [Loktanella sp. SALINAS62]MBS1303319.1 cytochrome c oxidase assembly protein [Loktanella sp. SALINAS62]